MVEEKTRKLCIVTFEEDVQDTHLLALTEDQIRLFEWLNNKHYYINVKVEKTAEII